MLVDALSSGICHFKNWDLSPEIKIEYSFVMYTFFVNYNCFCSFILCLDFDIARRKRAQLNSRFGSVEMVGSVGMQSMTEKDETILTQKQEISDLQTQIEMLRNVVEHAAAHKVQNEEMHG